MANPASLKPFKKGDPRINRKGRPKSFDALRSLAQSIAHEVVKDKNGNPVIVDNHLATAAEMILRQWATSKSPQLQRAFVEYAFGKVPDKQELTGADGKPINTDWKDEIVELLVSGTVTPDDVRTEFEPDVARELIGRAGLKGKAIP